MVPPANIKQSMYGPSKPSLKGRSWSWIRFMRYKIWSCYFSPIKFPKEIRNFFQLFHVNTIKVLFWLWWIKSQSFFCWKKHIKRKRKMSLDNLMINLWENFTQRYGIKYCLCSYTRKRGTFFAKKKQKSTYWKILKKLTSNLILNWFRFDNLLRKSSAEIAVFSYDKTSELVTIAYLSKCIVRTNMYCFIFFTITRFSTRKHC